jgi:hypothetical protein
MINEYNLKKLGYDFMGFKFDRLSELSFHHLLIPHRSCKGIERDGYVKWNGAILVQDTSHEYLHTIEQYDRDRFEYITERMRQMNVNGKLDNYNLERIEQALRVFETEYRDLTSKSGKVLIKDKYFNRIFYR